jgi:hypothetical protein
MWSDIQKFQLTNRKSPTNIRNWAADTAADLIFENCCFFVALAFPWTRKGQPQASFWRIVEANDVMASAFASRALQQARCYEPLVFARDNLSALAY